MGITRKRIFNGEGSCKYCGVILKDSANIRCFKCDIIWQEGFDFGESSVRGKVKFLVQGLINLGGIPKSALSQDKKEERT
jgi:hypothetical protein